MLIFITKKIDKIIIYMFHYIYIIILFIMAFSEITPSNMFSFTIESKHIEHLYCCACKNRYDMTSHHIAGIIRTCRKGAKICN
jgi:hypothetical protein